MKEERTTLTSSSLSLESELSEEDSAFLATTTGAGAAATFLSFLEATGAGAAFSSLSSLLESESEEGAFTSLLRGEGFFLVAFPTTATGTGAGSGAEAFLDEEDFDFLPDLSTLALLSGLGALTVVDFPIVMYFE